MATLTRTRQDDLEFCDHLDAKRERENWPNMFDGPAGTLPVATPAPSPDAQALIALDDAAASLSTIVDVPSAMDVRNKADAVRKYLKDAKQGLEAQNAAAKVKLLAERRVGELLAEMEKNPGAKGTGSNQHEVRSQAVTSPLPPTLEELGISKMQSSRFQAIAKLLPGFIESLAKVCTDDGKELTQTLVISHAKEKPPREELSERAEYRADVHAGKYPVPWCVCTHWPRLPAPWMEFQDSDDGEPCDGQMWELMAEPMIRFIESRAQFLAAYSAESGTDARARKFTSTTRKYLPQIEQHLRAMLKLMDQWYEAEPKSDGKRSFPFAY